MRRKVDFCADWRFIREDVGIEQADAVDAGTPNAFLCQRIPRKKKSYWSLKVRPCRHRCF